MREKKHSKTTIAATSDIHGFLDGLDEELAKVNPDVLVIAGDIHPCIRGMDADYWFNDNFFPFIDSLRCPVVAVPGNHDFYLSRVLSGKTSCSMPSNFHLLCDSSIEIAGLQFYGTPWVPWINGNWCFEASKNTLSYQFAKIPASLDVLVTHSPPLLANEFLDISKECPKKWQRHFGSTSLTEEICIKQPRLAVCGHIHTGQHGGVVARDKHDNPICRCYNVSRVNENYEIAFPIAQIEV